MASVGFLAYLLCVVITISLSVAQNRYHEDDDDDDDDEYYDFSDIDIRNAVRTGSSTDSNGKSPAYLINAEFGVDIFITFLNLLVLAAAVCLGIPGNLAVIYTVLFKRDMRSTFNFLLVSLSFGYIGFLLVPIPILYFLRIVNDILLFVKRISVGVSVYTLMIMSFERYLVTCPNLKHADWSTDQEVIGSGHPCAVRIGLYSVTWFFSIVLSVFELLRWKLLCEYECHVRFYSTSQFLFYFVLPVVVITSVYGVMAGKLRRSDREMLGSSSTVSLPGESFDVKPGECHDEQKKQLQADMVDDDWRSSAKLVLILVTLFVACQLPLHIDDLWYTYSYGPVQRGGLSLWWSLWRAFNAIWSRLYFFNAVASPLLIFYWNEDFRMYFNIYLSCFRGHQHHMEFPGLVHIDPEVEDGQASTLERKHSIPDIDNIP